MALKQKPTLKRIQGWEKIAMKKKINIGFPISISNIRFLFRNKSLIKNST